MFTLCIVVVVFFFESKQILLPVDTKKKHDFMIIITILFTFQVHQEEMAQLEV